MAVKGQKRGQYRPFSNTGHRGISQYKKGHDEGKFVAQISWYTKGGKWRGGQLKTFRIGSYDTLLEAIQARTEFINNLF